MKPFKEKHGKFAPIDCLVVCYWLTRVSEMDHCPFINKPRISLRFVPEARRIGFPIVGCHDRLARLHVLVQMLKFTVDRRLISVAGNKTRLLEQALQSKDSSSKTLRTP